MEKYLTERELAAKAGLSVQTLRVYRAEKRLFPYVKINRSVRYPEESCEKILKDLVIEATS